MYSRITLHLLGQEMTRFYTTDVGSYQLAYENNEIAVNLSQKPLYIPRCVSLEIQSSINVHYWTHLITYGVVMKERDSYFTVDHLMINITDRLELKLKIFDVVGIKFVGLMIGTTVLTEKICKGLYRPVTYTTSIPYLITCNLTELNLSTTQTLKDCVSTTFFDLTVQFQYYRKGFESPTYSEVIHTQLLERPTHNCISDPYFVLSQYYYQARFATITNADCFQNVQVVDFQCEITFLNGSSLQYSLMFYSIYLMTEPNSSIAFGMEMNEKNLVSQKDIPQIDRILYNLYYVYSNYSYKYQFVLSQDRILIATLQYHQLQLVQHRQEIRLIFSYSGPNIGLWDFKILFSSGNQVINLFIEKPQQVQNGYNVVVFNESDFRQVLDYNTYILGFTMKDLFPYLYQQKNLCVQIAASGDCKYVFRDIVYKRKIQTREAIAAGSVSFAVLVVNIIYMITQLRLRAKIDIAM